MKALLKSLITWLFCCVMITNSNAQGVPPVHSELIMPAYSGTPLLDVYLPLESSAYSYPSVYFRMDDAGTYKPQDLHVYSSNSGNYTNAYIAWIRTDPVSSAIIDTGYFYVPTSKTCINVGILQMPDNTVYVMAVYLDMTNGPSYDLYRWGPSGVHPSPGFTGTMHWDPAYPSTGLRISLDCFDLKRAVAVWEERPKYELIGGVWEAVHSGGIMVRAFEVGSTSPWFTSGETAKVDETDSLCRMPDVAMAQDGSTIRIAYYEEAATINDDLVVQSAPFAPIYGIGTGGIYTFGSDYGAGDIDHTGILLQNRDHIHIDCPDWNTSAGDIWAVVFKNNLNEVSIVYQPPVGLPPPPAPLSSPILDGYNCNPNVAYAPDAAYINVGWYNSVLDRYVARRMDIATPVFYIPTGFTYYLIQDIDVGGGCGIKSRLSFCKQQTIEDKGMFIAYPIADALSHYGDMRTKVVRWSSPTGPFSTFQNLPYSAGHIYIVPNPFSTDLKLSIKDYNGASLSVQLYDMMGKVLLSINDMDVQKTNEALSGITKQLPAGNYVLHVQHQETNTHFKLTKT